MHVRSRPRSRTRRASTKIGAALSHADNPGNGGVIAAADSGYLRSMDSADGGPESSRNEAPQESASGRRKDPLFAGISEICDAATLQAGADGAALAVLTPSANTRELVYATDAIAQQLDEAQYVIGEGPCFDAYLDNSPQFHPELKTIAQTSRWPTFAAHATQLGVQSLFAFPVPDTLRPMGVLELYRRTAGTLTDTEYVSATAGAAAISRRLQSNWENHVSYYGSVEKAVDAVAASGFEPGESPDPFTRTQIHVAAGMVAVQLGIDSDDAVDLLRAHSYARGRPISAVAADIIARRLTLRDS